MRSKSLLLILSLLPALAQAELYITVVQGLGGMPEYQSQFDTQREQVVAASTTLADADKLFVFNAEEATRETLLAHFAALNTTMSAEDRAAIYLIGHGSFDGQEYKFNIAGPDLSADDFKEILATLPGQNHFLVNTSSTSGAMVEAILGEKSSDTAVADPEASSPDYILIAATRNGNERNATHFGRFFAEALTNTEADLNKNNNISIQEAFDFADRNVTAYFEDEGKLATEHPQLRGNGAAQFSLARVNEVVFNTEDPLLTELLQKRADLDARIEELQLRRSEMSNADYLAQLQAFVLQAAELSEQIDAEQARQGASGGTN